jgi:4-hydroxy-tetrahydrodipicolinate synthase/2-dehydro-3-deoxy-phosphogluconate/2-dehydro-3-deoxy-6-phosphogalactonate aldolase
MPAHAPEPGADDPLELHGVVPPTVTAFDETGDLDPAATAAHAEFVVDRGVHGVFPLGTNGEFALCTPDERERVVDAVVDAVGDAVPVIAGVGAPSTRETVANAERAVAVGADGVVAVTPYYYPLDAEAAVAHYRRVAGAVDVPVYVYHIPSKTGVHLDRETVADIAAVDGIAGLKDSSKDVPWLGQLIDDVPTLTYMAGSDSLLTPGLSLGCTGLVSAVANVAPELVVDCYEAFDAGETERARERQSTVYDVRAALKRGPYMAGVKAALSLRGDAPDAGGLRAPLRGMDADKRAALERELTALGVL